MPSPAPHLAFRLLILASLAIGMVTPDAARAAEATVRVHGQAVSSNANAVGLTNDFGSGPGAYLGVEFRLNDRLGIEAGVAWFELEASEQQAGVFFASEASVALTVVPVTVALDVHLTPQKRYDLYLAPKIGWAFFDEVELVTTFDFGPIPFPGLPGLPVIPGFGDTFVTRFRTDDQFVFGLRLGLDVPFGGGSWAFSSSVEYTDMDLEIDAFGIPVPAVALDPFSVGAGIAYRF